MSTIIFPSPIFGPVHSRRLGISLGINVCPGDGKICSFDCIYCEIGFNADTRPHQKMPSRGLIRTMLREKLEKMKAEGKLPDTLTFSGNGEPTGHPEFSEIVDDVLKLRDEYCPKAKVSVLTNAFLITHQPIFDALLKVDNAELKLDTVDEEYIERVDRPNAALHLDKILEAMERFGNRAIIQTMFLHGSFDGKRVDNVDEKYVGPWLDAVEKIGPRLVTIYTIDRDTPAHDLQKATHEELDAIAERVRARGLTCQVSY